MLVPCKITAVLILLRSDMFVENRSDNFDTRIRRLVYGFFPKINRFREFSCEMGDEQLCLVVIKIVCKLE